METTQGAPGLWLPSAQEPQRVNPEAVKWIRQALGLSMEEMAVRMGVRYLTILRMETGKSRAMPYHENRAMLEKLYQEALKHG